MLLLHLTINRREYLELKKRRENLALTQQENQSSLKSLQHQVQTLQDEIETLSQKISQAETALTRYENERETYEAALGKFYRTGQ